MNISLLISLFPFLLSGPQVPNYYRSYPTARSESSRSGKEMLMFFSSNDCETCNAAWVAFTKDASAVNKYVSTQVIADDFDGQILYDHFDPGSLPAWVVLDASGKVKERWQGGWKDAYGKGTVYAEEVPLTVVEKKPESKPATATATSNGTLNPSSVNSTPPAAPKSTSTKETVVKSEPKTEKTAEATAKSSSDSSASSTSSASSASFVIQAGYFGSEANAQKCLSDLKAKGFSQFSIKPLQQNGSTFYRVWSSTFPSESAAQAKLQDLTNAGIKGTVKSSS